MERSWAQARPVMCAAAYLGGCIVQTGGQVETNGKLGERALDSASHEAFMAKLRKHFQINACRVVARPLGQGTVDRASLSYRLLSALEVQELIYDPALQMTAQFVRAAQGRGDSCIAAFDGKQVAA